jgi:phosphoenolpyruvate-protein kinase (PTS system EI component)
LPTEEEQYQWYSELADSAYPLQVTIRAFDIGSDKSLTAAHEPNPALGLRGIRYLLSNRNVFRKQVRAILQASKHKNIRFLLPMVSGVTEFREARELIKQWQEELVTEGIQHNAKTPLGVMIETPASVIMAQELAQEADFFSIGTNDLTQYTLAADRQNEYTAETFDGFNPAVLRLIQMTVQAAQNHDIPVSVCGDMAAHPAATNVLVGLGIKELSVAPTYLLPLKKRIRQSSLENAQLVTQEVLHYTSGMQVRTRLMQEA